MMYVLFRLTQVDDTYGYKQTEVHAVAVCESRGALERVMFEDALPEDPDGTYRTNDGVAYRIEEVLHLTKDGSAS